MNECGPRNPRGRIAPRALPVLLPALLAFLPYLVLLGGDLVGDGRALVRGHETLRTATRSPANFLHLFREDYWDGLAPASGLYRPLTTSVLALLYGVAGETAWPYRALATLLHAACAAAALAFGRNLFGTGKALLCAGIFAVHPVHTEAVGDVANLGELLASLFSLVLLARLLRRRDPASGSAAAGCLFFAALLAKESAASTLLVAALLLWIVRRGDVGARPRRWAPLLPLALALVANLVLRAAALGFLLPRYLPTNRIENPLLFESLETRLATSAKVLAHALGLLVFPARLSADYSLETFRLSTSFLEPAFLASLALLAALALAGVLLRKRAPAAAFGILAALASFAPTSNILVPTGTLFAERHLLLPSFYLAVAVVGFLPDPSSLSHRSRRLFVAAAASLLALLAARSAARAREWRSPAVLTEVTARRDSPRSVRVLYNLAAERRKAGDRAGSTEALRRALAIEPGFFHARAALALDLRDSGDSEAAVSEWRLALREGLVAIPGGSALWEESAAAFNEALALELRRPEEAVEYWNAMLSDFPDSPDVSLALAQALDAAGRPEAEGHLRTAARDRANARVLLAHRLAAAGRTEEALSILRAPLPERAGLDGRAQVSFAEGQILFSAGRNAEALAAFERALSRSSRPLIVAAARAGVALARLAVRGEGEEPAALQDALANGEKAFADPDLPEPLRREGLRILADVYRDLGEPEKERKAREAAATPRLPSPR